MYIILLFQHTIYVSVYISSNWFLYFESNALILFLLE
jgi:hypothetical protein